MRDLYDLLVRVEAANGEDASLDVEIERRLVRPVQDAIHVPHYTAPFGGIPHCLRLVQEKLPAWRIELSICPDDAEERRCGCYLSPPDARYDEDRLWHETYTLPLAILAALLRALIAEAENAA